MHGDQDKAERNMSYIADRKIEMSEAELNTRWRLLKVFIGWLLGSLN